jgi:hypothetical protein
MPAYTFECVNPQCEQQRHEVLSLAEHSAAAFWHCRKKMRQVIGIPQLVRDIDPYISAAADVNGQRRRITSRSDHRNFLKDNGYAEIGTEIPKAKPAKLDLTTGADVKRAIEQLQTRAKA